MCLIIFGLGLTAYIESYSTIKALNSIKVASDTIINGIYLSGTDASDFSKSLDGLLKSVDNFYSD